MIILVLLTTILVFFLLYEYNSTTLVVTTYDFIVSVFKEQLHLGSFLGFSNCKCYNLYQQKAMTLVVHM